MFWQELPPSGGELTSQDNEYDCHKVAPRAMTHSLSVCPPAPFLPSSMGKRCYNSAIQKGPALRVCCTHPGLLFIAAQDQVALECTVRWNDAGPLYLPSGAPPSMRRPGELRFCFVFQIRKGKITSLHQYYDMMTQIEQLGLVPATEQAT
jgi:hypothetical protein